MFNYCLYLETTLRVEGISLNAQRLFRISIFNHKLLKISNISQEGMYL